MVVRVFRVYSSVNIVRQTTDTNRALWRIGYRTLRALGSRNDDKAWASSFFEYGVGVAVDNKQGRGTPK